MRIKKNMLLVPNRALGVTLAMALTIYSALLTPSAEAAKPTKPTLSPEYRITLKNGSQLIELKNSAWFAELSNSNLYRGLSKRLAPALYTLGENNDNAWSGRLIDFIAEKMLSNRPLVISYYHSNYRVSPFSVQLPNLSVPEMSLLEALLRKVRTGAAIQTEIHDSSGRKLAVPVTPIAIKNQKFAVVLTNHCLTLGRDPKIAAASSNLCSANKLPIKDALVEVDTKQFAPNLSNFLDRFAKLKDRLVFELKWDSRKKSFQFHEASLGLGKDHHIKKGILPSEVLKSIPSDTTLMATVWVPRPKDFKVATLLEYLKNGPELDKVDKAIPVTLAFWGMSRPAKRLIANVAVFIPASGYPSEATVSELVSLYSYNQLNDTFVANPCGTVLVITDQSSNLEFIEKTCKKNGASLDHRAPKLVEPIKKEFSMAVLIDLPEFAKSALKLGWREEKDIAFSPELVEADKLLHHLPTVSLSASATDRLTFSGVSQ